MVLIHLLILRANYSKSSISDSVDSTVVLKVALLTPIYYSVVTDGLFFLGGRVRGEPCEGRKPPPGQD